MGVSSRADRDHQRKRMLAMKMSDVFEKKEYPENITTNEVKCQKCGFKTRYKFIRCPECNEVQM